MFSYTELDAAIVLYKHNYYASAIAIAEAVAPGRHSYSFSDASSQPPSALAPFLLLRACSLFYLGFVNDAVALLSPIAMQADDRAPHFCLAVPAALLHFNHCLGSQRDKSAVEVLTARLEIANGSAPSPQALGLAALTYGLFGRHALARKHASAILDSDKDLHMRITTLLSFMFYTPLISGLEASLSSTKSAKCAANDGKKAACGNVFHSGSSLNTHAEVVPSDFSDAVAELRALWHAAAWDTALVHAARLLASPPCPQFAIDALAVLYVLCDDPARFKDNPQVAAFHCRADILTALRETMTRVEPRNTLLAMRIAPVLLAPSLVPVNMLTHLDLPGDSFKDHSQLNAFFNCILTDREFDTRLAAAQTLALSTALLRARALLQAGLYPEARAICDSALSRGQKKTAESNMESWALGFVRNSCLETAVLAQALSGDVDKNDLELLDAASRFSANQSASQSHSKYASSAYPSPSLSSPVALFASSRSLSANPTQSDHSRYLRFLMDCVAAIANSKPNAELCVTETLDSNSDLSPAEFEFNFLMFHHALIMPDFASLAEESQYSHRLSLSFLATQAPPLRALGACENAVRAVVVPPVTLAPLYMHLSSDLLSLCPYGFEETEIDTADSPSASSGGLYGCVIPRDSRLYTSYSAHSKKQGAYFFEDPVKAFSALCTFLKRNVPPCPALFCLTAIKNGFFCLKSVQALSLSNSSTMSASIDGLSQAWLSPSVAAAISLLQAEILIFASLNREARVTLEAALANNLELQRSPLYNILTLRLNRRASARHCPEPEEAAKKIEVLLSRLQASKKIDLRTLFLCYSERAYCSTSFESLQKVVSDGFGALYTKAPLLAYQIRIHEPEIMLSMSYGSVDDVLALVSQFIITASNEKNTSNGKSALNILPTQFHSLIETNCFKILCERAKKLSGIALNNTSTNSNSRIAGSHPDNDGFSSGLTKAGVARGLRSDGADGKAAAKTERQLTQKSKQALAHVETCRKLVSENSSPTAYLALANALIACDEWDAAVDTVMDARTRFPNDLALALEASKVLIANYGYIEAAALLEEVMRPSASSGHSSRLSHGARATLEQCRVELAKIYDALGRDRDVMRLLETAPTPRTAECATLLAKGTATLRKDTKLALQILDTALTEVSADQGSLNVSTGSGHSSSKLLAAAATANDLHMLWMARYDLTNVWEDLRRALDVWLEASRINGGSKKRSKFIPQATLRALQLCDTSIAREYVDAVASELLRCDPRSATGLLLRARTLANGRDFVAAIRLLATLLDDDPSCATGLALYIELVHRSGVLRNSQDKNLTQTRFAVNKSNLASADPGFRYCCGLYQKFLGNVKDAVVAFETCLSLSPAKKSSANLSSSPSSSPLGSQDDVGTFAGSLGLLSSTVLQTIGFGFSTLDEWSHLASRQLLDYLIFPDIVEINAPADREGIVMAQRLLDYLNEKTYPVEKQMWQCLLLMASRQRGGIDAAMTLTDEMPEGTVACQFARAVGNILLQRDSKSRNNLKRLALEEWRLEVAHILEASWLLLAESQLQSGGAKNIGVVGQLLGLNIENVAANDSVGDPNTASANASITGIASPTSSRASVPSGSSRGTMASGAADGLVRAVLETNKQNQKAWELYASASEESNPNAAADYWQSAWATSQYSASAGAGVALRLARLLLRLKRPEDAIDVCHRMRQGPHVDLQQQFDQILASARTQLRP